MDDLAAFLRARLDEDEVRAKERAEPGGMHQPWQEARDLREVAAKRAILEIHKVYSEPEIQNIDHIDKKWNMGWVERAETGHAVYWCEECDHDRDYDHISSRQEGCRTLRALAAVYSDHPGYRQEWAS